ncbi:MAG: S8 family serine peptidase [Nanoarchaeota archaeon]|nr:S8 family serine peptidase [Nanoarchaeota archaeon]MBU1269409.1 S8 family serine peptidase [Nanoarchaeota archaeon]MBU1605172.1 S8 family serine peptidase [Nanoarchaeota archaeon]MBU2442906.1 S8 family serine peptidase [Nanoarchaeota archaeon]
MKYEMANLSNYIFLFLLILIGLSLMSNDVPVNIVGKASDRLEIRFVEDIPRSINDDFLVPVERQNFLAKAENKRNSYIIEFKQEPSYVKEAASVAEIRLLEKKESSMSAITGMAVALDKKKIEVQAKITLQEEIIAQERAQTREELLRIMPDFESKQTASFTVVFNGIAVEMSKDEADAVSKLPSIKAVYPDLPVHATTMNSVPFIGAGARKNFSGTGLGVKIGIIDTGVDYTHPDLGGCFGIGCKVIGGYDFVNHDDDPMDDNGHGTHVAGIVAGNGALKGVAPDAEILSFKVLNAAGSGSSSGIIQAISTAVVVGADVVSMSLGGIGNPDDAKSIAVDNAVTVGVIVVVAAGNKGPYEMTVSSPATARKAITVGATGQIPDNQYDIAYFSSTGPVRWASSPFTFYQLIKPDVVAPGSLICAAQLGDVLNNSQCFDSDHILLSGTSMATPHVAGAAALIKQMHPDWNPLEVKAALKNTARDLGFEKVKQGYGLINVNKAINQPRPPVAFIDALRSNGVIDISGTVSGQTYTLEYYDTYWKHWKLLVNSSFNNSFVSRVLYSGFDTRRLDEGLYPFRLIVQGENGTSRDENILFVNNIHISKPVLNKSYLIIPGSTFDIKGRITEGYQSYNIKIRAVGGEWTSSGLTIHLENGTLARLNTSLIQGENFDLKVSVQYPIKLVEEIIPFTLIVPKPGWPVRISGSFEETDSGTAYTWIGMISPVAEDLDGDGKKELSFFIQGNQEGHKSTFIILDEDGSMIAYVPLNCYVDPRTFVTIGNVDLDPELELIVPCSNSFLIFNSKGKLEYSIRTPFSISDNLYAAVVLADINNDNSSELIFGGYGPTANLMIMDLQGSPLDGFPVLLQKSLISHVNTPAVGQLDEDSYMEIVVGTQDWSDENKLLSEVKVYEHDGTLKWSRNFGYLGVSDPVIADINNDGSNEIIFSSGLGIHVLDRNGNWLLNKQFGTNMAHSQVAVADLDKDNDLEIIFGYGFNLYAVHHNGQIIFSVLDEWLPHHPPVIADINYDGYLDIIYNSDNDIKAVDRNGRLLNGFPKEMETIAYSSPTVTDLDGDGNLDLISSSNWLEEVHRGIIYRWEFMNKTPITDGDALRKRSEKISETAKKTLVSWPMYQFNPQHTGFYTSLNDSLPTEPVCYESDGGYNIFEQGYLSYGENKSYDYCDNSGTVLYEYFCKNSNPLVPTRVVCSKKCNAGACTTESRDYIEE